MNNDVLEVLQELEELVKQFKDGREGIKEELLDFIGYQRSIYSGSKGECAC